ncbi:MAG: RpoL/Rpb11 RNA polymerase subunit family protein [Nanobdellota archaeon]
MELKILEKKPKKIVFQIPGTDHTLCNILKKELLSVDGVAIASYAIEHPQIGIPTMLIETTSSKIKPLDIIESALAAIKKKNTAFVKHFKK